MLASKSIAQSRWHLYRVSRCERDAGRLTEVLERRALELVRQEVGRRGGRTPNSAQTGQRSFVGNRGARTLDVTGNGPLSLGEHRLDGLGDFGAGSRDVVELCLVSNGQGEYGDRTLSWLNGRASWMFLSVVLRSPSSAWILVAEALADSTCARQPGPTRLASSTHFPTAPMQARRRSDAATVHGGAHSGSGGVLGEDVRP